MRFQVQSHTILRAEGMLIHEKEGGFFWQSQKLFPLSSNKLQQSLKKQEGNGKE